MSDGVSFAGNGADDTSNSTSGTNPPNQGKGGDKEVTYTGNGASDVTHAVSGTNPPSGSKPGGKGEVRFAGNGSDF